MIHHAQLRWFQVRNMHQILSSLVRSVFADTLMSLASAVHHQGFKKGFQKRLQNRAAGWLGFTPPNIRYVVLHNIRYTCMHNTTCCSTFEIMASAKPSNNPCNFCRDCCSCDFHIFQIFKIQPQIMRGACMHII